MKPIFCLLFCLPIFLLAQDCPNVEGSEVYTDLAYGPRGNHCEGIYRKRVSSYDVRLASYTLGELRYHPDSGQVIELQLPATVRQIAQIQGFGIPSDVYYRLDGQIHPGKTFEWNSDEILIHHPRTKFDRNIGIYGYTSTDNQTIYLPLVIGSNSNNKSKRLKFVSTTRISQVEWRLDRGKYQQYQPVGRRRSYRSDKPIELILPEDIPSGTYTLYFKSKEYNGTATNTENITIII